VLLTKTILHRQKPPLQRKAKGLFFVLALLGFVLIFPTLAGAEFSLKNYWLRLLNNDPASAEESALAPQLPMAPDSREMLHALRSPIPSVRLQAIEALSRSIDLPYPTITALVRATQDTNADVSVQAEAALTGLCRSGHAEQVVRAFRLAWKQAAPTVILERGEYFFKITDPADEKRIESLLSNLP
jgi:hypothetical protein